MTSSAWLKAGAGLLALLLGLACLRYEWRARAALNFPEAGLNITDSAGFAQLSAWQAQGRIYGPPEEGLGLLYAPGTAAFSIALHKALGIELSPPSVRLLGQACLALALLFLGMALRLETQAPPSLLALALGGALLAELLSGTHESVYTGQLRLLQLSALWLALLLPGKASAFAAALLVACLGCGSPNYLILGLALLPRFWRGSGRAAMLLGGLAGLVLLAWAYGGAWRWYWCLQLPLSKPFRDLPSLLVESLNPRWPWPYLAVGGLGFLALLRSPGKGYAGWLAFAALLGSLPPAMKLGGGAANLLPFAWLAWPAGLCWAWNSGKPKALAAAALGLAFLLSSGSGILLGSAGPRVPTATDLQNEARLRRALDWAGQKKLSFWVDSAPGYYASRRIPRRFEAAHIWDQRVAGDLRSERAFFAELEKGSYRLLVLHSDPPGLSPFTRTLGAQALQLVEKRYLKVYELPRDPASDAGMGDPRFNGSLAFYLERGQAGLGGELKENLCAPF